ncbi:hypothetical protein NDU88_005732 [Pleurodeles waltl]|uniref:Uncharacterized protein n=1 Tax=Pleurodeles waltl TaxID=8319 RepID=A0AAV7WVJ5_PLEWA|nr:hypothetical protein NDU88_005732 [Pleurodeles waltl]
MESCLSYSRGTYEGVDTTTTVATCTSEGADRLQEPGSKARDVRKTLTRQRGEEDLQRLDREKRMNGEDKDVSGSPETCLLTTHEERNLNCLGEEMGAFSSRVPGSTWLSQVRTICAVGTGGLWG